MKYKTALLLLTAALPAVADVVINEVDSDTSGTDILEFVELYNTDGTNSADLTGLVLVFYNGSSDTSYAAYDLDGYIIPPNGYFVVGNSGVTGASITFSNNFLQNGADAVALYTGDATSFPNGTAVTSTNLIDAIVYDTDDADDSGLLTGLSQVAQYNENENSNKDFESISRVPDGGALIATVAPTPNAANPSAGGTLTISLDTNTISEDGSTFITGTVTASSPVSGDLEVTVTLSDDTEAETFNATIFDTTTEGTFFINAKDDAWPDGDQLVTVTVSAPTFTGDDDTFTVTDDDADYLLVVNEVYYAADASLTDANGDGTTDNTAPSEEEFIELVNVSGTTLDLSGVTIYDNFGGSGIHTFPDGTVLDAGCAILVFAGGDIPQGSTAAFGNTHVQKVAGSGLYLDDDGTDFLRVIDTNGTVSGLPGGELQNLPLPDQTASPTGGSYALQTDGVGSSGYALHTTIPATSGASYSPGTNLDGTTPFCALTDSLSINYNVPDISEAGGTVVAGGTVSIPAPAASDIYVYIETSDGTELASPTAGTAIPVVILSGTSSADFDLPAVDDLDIDGTVSVTLTARATGYLNGSGAIDVTDDDTVVYTPPNLIITELMFNPATAEPPGEWIEIYNADSVSVDLAGVLIDDEDSSNWSPISGGILDPGKYAVIYDITAGSAADVRAEWGIPADALVIGVTWGSLANSPAPGNEVIQLLDAFSNVLDTVDFDDDGTIWPTDDGSSSTVLISTAYDDVSNDTGTNWVLSSAPSQGNAVHPSGPIYSTSDLGSPGFDGTSATGPIDYASWATINSVVEGPDGDDDDDGIKNLIEYALGLDPQAFESLASAFDGSALTFTAGTEAAANGDVSYVIETSPDLSDPWTPQVSGLTSGMISYTLPTGETKIFARLRVEQAP